MSKKHFKSQASSSRAISGSFASGGGLPQREAFGTAFSLEGTASSPLSYIYEPPDLGGISNPSVVVSLKNLQKKDGTTKAKALEEIESYITSLQRNSESIDDAILQAWVGLSWKSLISHSK